MPRGQQQRELDDGDGRAERRGRRTGEGCVFVRVSEKRLHGPLLHDLMKEESCIAGKQRADECELTESSLSLVE